MSAIELSPNSKLSNAVYLAFGASLGIWFFKSTDPAILWDPKNAIAAILFSASLLGTLLYYIQPERGVRALLKWWILRRNDKTMTWFIILRRMKSKTWLKATIEKWETPVEEADFGLTATLKGPDLFNETWSIYGGVYFIIGIPFLLSTVLPTLVHVAIWTFVFTLTILIAMYINYEGFPEWCYMIALLRGIEETKSLQTDNTAQLPPEPFVIEVLNAMIYRKEWSRFTRRFKGIIEEYEGFASAYVEEIGNHFEKLLLEYHSFGRSRRTKIDREIELVTRLIRDASEGLSNSQTSDIRDLIEQTERIVSSKNEAIEFYIEQRLFLKYPEEVLRVFHDYISQLKGRRAKGSLSGESIETLVKELETLPNRTAEEFVGLILIAIEYLPTTKDLDLAVKAFLRGSMYERISSPSEKVISSLSRIAASSRGSRIRNRAQAILDKFNRTES